MTKKNDQEIIYSPYSKEDGVYPLKDLTIPQLEAIENLAKEILTENEWITPLIPEVIVRNSIQWYAQLFIEELLLQITPQNEKPSLDEFKLIAEQYVITYNLKGAKWFQEAFAEYCLLELQKHFEIVSNEEAGLEIIPIRVTSSSGYKTFDEEANAKIWDPNKVRGKHLISLDDIGDRGTTQEAIKELAKKAGALDTSTVNLVEKMVPNNVPKEKQKKYHPDIALLAIGYLYVLGWGLDDGQREKTRKFDSIVALSQDKPGDTMHTFQGNLSTKSPDST